MDSSDTAQNDKKTFPLLPQDGIRVLGRNPAYDDSSASDTLSRQVRDVKIKPEECEELLLAANPSNAGKNARAGELYLPKDYNRLERPKGILCMYPI